MYILSVRYYAKCDGSNSSKGGSLQKKTVLNRQSARSCITMFILMQTIILLINLDCLVLAEVHAL